MRSVGILLLVLVSVLLAGCRSKLTDESLYRFPQQPITVLAPRECVVDMWIGESANTVDFNTGQYYWEMSGQYFVIVSDLPESVDSAASFVAAMRPWFDEVFQPRESEFFDLDLVAVDEREMQVNGDPAYRVMFEDPGNGVVVATARMHRTRITIAALAYHLEEGQDAQGEIPWDCYEAFVSSVEEVP